MANRLNVQNIYASDAQSTPSITIDSSGISAGTLGSGVVFPANHVIQVDQKEDSAPYTNSTTTPAQATQTSTFTLSNSSNKVLVTVNCLVRAVKSTAAGVRLAIYRGSVDSGEKITSGTEPQIYFADAGSEFYSIATLQYLDTPGGSTSYSLGFYKHSGSGTVYIKGDFFRTIILLQEISV